MIDALQRLVWQLENETLLLEPNQLRQRLEALDLLDAHLSDAFQSASDTQSSMTELHRRAKAIHARLEAVNCELYRAIRNEIQSGNRPDALLGWVRSLAAIEDVDGAANDMGYDHLDELVSGVLQFVEPDATLAPREPEMVFYQPTPARHIFNLIDRTAFTPTDVLVDLGSGLGHVALLVSICTCARSVGIELEAAYVERARQCAQSLNLNMITFVQQDVRSADLSAGTVFYLYSPFTGSILKRVLNRLRHEAATRQIQICSYGPCTSVVAEEPWLEAMTVPVTYRVTIFRSRSRNSMPLT